MTVDWRALAQARGLQLPEADLVRVASALDALEAAFRPLTSLLQSDTEPAVILSEDAVTGE